jgi:cyclic pyranopterin phosphate synthase
MAPLWRAILRARVLTALSSIRSTPTTIACAGSTTPSSNAGPARYVRVRETGGRVGFITPLTHNFCESCNRVRLTCTGMLYMCLGQNDDADLRTPVRASEGDELLEAAIQEAIGRKPKGHDFIIDRRHAGAAVPRHMSVTGG